MGAIKKPRHGLETDKLLEISAAASYTSAIICVKVMKRSVCVFYK